ncbi:choline dehydrogenase [Parasphingopyxis algicola]|uniref:choline dehydrogenase n=1 Tax=Parasphingopyxis algicola TaxID=2026624 RepID=UPI0015A0E0AC|nr:choline dehydrogenase [Parasphingopyxis algicola]QLC24927.1 choline dehydrogenase [Parasphingopyxis algicola]
MINADKMKEFDYVIVGGGSAGCTLAARLSEDPANSVLLIEAGASRGNLFDFWKIEMPAAFDNVWRNPKYNWMFQGEPEPTLNNRRIFQPRGKVLGGSSAINGMVFIRGHALDFERWANEEGAMGWSWREVLPYFKRLETWEAGETRYRGGSGPVYVRKGNYPTELYDIFVEAGKQAGYPVTDDINGECQEGFGALQANISNGVRASAAQAYIRPNSGRSNLTIVDRAHAEGLIIEGNRVSGVNFQKAGKSGFSALARKEVIVASGAIGSPQLLMLSGIGPEDELKTLGIECKVNLPGVGQNLQDHPLVYMKFQIEKPVSMSRYMRPDLMAYAGTRWVATHTGPGATNHVETCALMRSDPAVAHPDVEIQYLPIMMDHDDGVKPGLHGFTYCIGPSRVEGVGWVKLASRDPRAAPRILSNFLATDYDLHLMRRAVEMGREVASQPAHKGLGVKEIEPGPHVGTRTEMIEYLRNNVAGDFHLCGTCKMGSGRDAVVDSELRVHGIEGLRVVDASIMPSIVNANTNATTIMIAEKASDMILGKPPLPQADVPIPGRQPAAA